MAVPATECFGCVINRPTRPAAPRVTYGRDIAPILAANCQACHRPGDIAPFPLLSFADAKRSSGCGDIARATTRSTARGTDGLTELIGGESAPTGVRPVSIS